MGRHDEGGEESAGEAHIITRLKRPSVEAKLGAPGALTPRRRRERGRRRKEVGWRTGETSHHHKGEDKAWQFGHWGQGEREWR